MAKTDEKSNPWEPFKSQLHEYYLPVFLHLVKESFPKTWKSKLPRDSTYHNVHPIDVWINDNGVEFSFE